MRITKVITALLLISLLFTLLAIGTSAAYSENEIVDENGNPIYGDTSTEMIWQMEPATAKALLIILASVFAVALPLAPLTVFTVKLIRKRKAFEAIDFIILGVSVLWLISGIVIFVLIL